MEAAGAATRPHGVKKTWLSRSRKQHPDLEGTPRGAAFPGIAEPGQASPSQAPDPYRRAAWRGRWTTWRGASNTSTTPIHRTRPLTGCPVIFGPSRCWDTGHGDRHLGLLRDWDQHPQEHDRINGPLRTHPSCLSADQVAATTPTTMRLHRRVNPLRGNSRRVRLMPRWARPRSGIRLRSSARRG